MSFSTSFPSTSNNAGKRKNGKPPNKLVLCFDGTGNKFTGTSTDTNIVKLYQMCDRDAKGQYHYYQPGIGTYTAGEASMSRGVFGSIQRWFSQTIDNAIGTTFTHHVLAGYRFVMRYYKPGDLIYIFGFSRGAFTARFLARMITEIGLLSRGNEEMVPFAYRTYEDYESGARFKTRAECEEFMSQFKETFCRQNVSIHFLGLFDCVNSITTLDIPFRKKTYLPVFLPAATYIRHAVSIDERRLKFKVALFCQDDDDCNHETEHTQDIKEVWFPGNHGDVGGGWATKTKDDIQLSDVALEWMINELDSIPEPPEEKLAFNHRRDEFLNRMKAKQTNAIDDSEIHDALSFGKGWNMFGVMFWWLFEILPLFKRMELINHKWVDIYWPPNLGSPRDMPDCANLHPSVMERVQHADGGQYRPQNEGFFTALSAFSAQSRGSGPSFEV
ncbi:hypothetical protein BZA77DRAFT_309341 [Pyronema omphalodes]|nr:hypothetical protein BZA77DRAFT_309341 [Pyronema omphalodes]